MVIGGTSMAPVRDLEIRVKAIEDGAPPPPVDYSVTARSATVARPLVDITADWVSVLGFIPLNLHAGIRAGTNITDLQPYIQNAVATLAASLAPFALYFPLGAYLVGAPVVLPIGASFHLFGAGFGSIITGNVAGFIFDHHTDTGGSTASPSIKDLRLVNTNAGAATGGIWLENTTGFLLEHLRIEAKGYGIRMRDNTFTGRVSTVTLSGSGTGIGIQVPGHVSIENCDVTGWNEGVRAFGANLHLVGGRYEVNKTGIRLGVDDAGTTSALTRSFIGGVSMEANDTAIHVQSATNLVIAGEGHQGSTNSPAGRSIYGLKIEGGDVVVIGASFHGEYSKAAIYAANCTPTFIRTTASNGYTGPGATDWDIRVNPENLSIIGGVAPDLRGQGDTSTPDFLRPSAVQGLTYLDVMNATVAARNLRGKNLTVSSGATFVDVVFPVQRTSGQAAFNGAGVIGAGGSLAAATYYYMPTFVTPLGECTGIESSVVVGAANSTVTWSFFNTGTSDDWKRRIYRGTASGVYDGYYELPLKSSAPWTDTGAAFSGVKSPPPAGVNTPSGAELDASYGVEVTPQWNTTAWVTAKATTGFRINFGTAPGVDSAVDWFLVR